MKRIDLHDLQQATLTVKRCYVAPQCEILHLDAYQVLANSPLRGNAGRTPDSTTSPWQEEEDDN